MNLLIYFAAILILPLLFHFYLKRTYSKYLKVHSQGGMTGAETARKILKDNNIHNVIVEITPGKLSDHYDPRGKTVRLSPDVYDGTSVASLAIAAHEVGHAIQHAENYGFLRMRHSLVPVANIGSGASFVFILAGVLLSSPNLLLVGILAMSLAVLFQFVTLPVEFNASSRAMNQLVSSGIIRNNEEGQAKKVLNAAAMTYVAATVVAVAELLRFVLMFAGLDD